jgi:hypothetical protein
LLQKAFEKIVLIGRKQSMISLDIIYNEIEGERVSRNCAKVRARAKYCLADGVRVSLVG